MATSESTRSSVLDAQKLRRVLKHFVAGLGESVVFGARNRAEFEDRSESFNTAASIAAIGRYGEFIGDVSFRLPNRRQIRRLDGFC